MLNFTFYNPTKIVFGKGQLVELDNLVPSNCKVLIIYGGGSVKKTGVLDMVKTQLGTSNREVFEFGGILPNPQFDILMDAVRLVRQQNIDFILAIGGGSVMDGTKFIAITAKNEEFMGREEEVLNFGFAGVPAEKSIPFGTVATLPATGSEMNSGAVISRGDDKLVVMSELNFPQFSILDPELTFTLPPKQVANGVVDTFVHTTEQYVTYPVEARFQDRTAEGILNTLIEIGTKTVEEPENYDVRANLVWCATMALNGLIGAGVPQDWNTHMIGHEITALSGIDHGRTLAIIQPAVWKVRRRQKADKLIQYAERVWGITTGSIDEKIDGAIEETEKFFHSLNVPTRLSDYGLDASFIDKVIANLEKHEMTALSEHGDVTLDISRKILEVAL
ncbi:iron-containing alcohol dehydrogenase [Lentisphaerota bacterium WC36G]|nr:iron-containing alcohol dehydrogenase [Lentisphaerae bacterium WC36]